MSGDLPSARLPCKCVYVTWVSLHGAVVPNTAQPPTPAGAICRRSTAAFGRWSGASSDLVRNGLNTHGRGGSTPPASTLCRSFANTELVPNAAKWDQEHSFPKDAVKQLGEMGLMGVAIPEEVGWRRDELVVCAACPASRRVGWLPVRGGAAAGNIKFLKNTKPSVWRGRHGLHGLRHRHRGALARLRLDGGRWG